MIDYFSLNSLKSIVKYLILKLFLIRYKADQRILRANTDQIYCFYCLFRDNENQKTYFLILLFEEILLFRSILTTFSDFWSNLCLYKLTCHILSRKFSSSLFSTFFWILQTHLYLSRRVYQMNRFSRQKTVIH